MGRVREGSRELREQRGVKGSEGSKGERRERTGSEGERRERRGAKEAKGSEGSECISILGFRVPTTCGRKSSVITCSAYVSPPPGSTMPTQFPFT